MGNVIIIGILVVIVIFAIAGSAKHFKGEGGCCGGGGGTVREYKELSEPKIGEKTLQIEGMHCENCRNRIEHAINKMDGVVCNVSLKKKTATISYSREIDEELLKNTIKRLGYEVVNIY